MSDPEPWEPDPTASFDLFEICLLFCCMLLVFGALVYVGLR